MTRPARHEGHHSGDIVILSSRRGGSTLLMEMLAAERGVRPVNEPFRENHVRNARLPTGLEGIVPDERTKVVDVAPSSTELYRQYLTDWRRTRICGPYDPLDGDAWRKTDRRVLKIVRALGISDFIDQVGFGAIVYLMRHPIPTALSMLQTGRIKVEGFLQHKGFVGRALTPEQIEFSWKVLQTGSPLEQCVLEWCLDQVVPFKTLQKPQSPWMLITYEELLLSPDGILDVLAQRLQMSDVDRMRSRLGEPSASTSAQRVRHIQQGSAAAQVNGWRQRTSAAEEQRLFRIVDQFGLPVYECGSPVARPEYLQNPSTATLA